LPPKIPVTHPTLSSVTPEEQPAVRPQSARAPAARSSLPPPPREVLERVRQRDPEALEAFFEHYFDRVFGLVLRLLGDRTAAEDVTQDVFYKVHRAAHQLDAARDPGPWITAIAYNACRDVWRSGAYRMSRRSDSVDEKPDLDARMPRAMDDPERDAVTAERARLVQAALAELPEPLRACIVLFDYEGLGHQEIADLLGIGHAAARKRHSRALEALGQRLKPVLGDG